MCTQGEKDMQREGLQQQAFNKMRLYIVLYFMILDVSCDLNIRSLSRSFLLKKKKFGFNLHVSYEFCDQDDACNWLCLCHHQKVMLLLTFACAHGILSINIVAGKNEMNGVC